MKPAIDREQLLTQLRWRYATQQFDPKRKISAEDWSALEDALVLTPSSFGLQPWKFVVVTDRATREQLMAASYRQRQIVDASHLVVFAIKKNLAERDVDAHIDRIIGVCGGSREQLTGSRDVMVRSIVKGLDSVARNTWAAYQVYIALGNFLTSAALLGIDACPMEGIVPEKYDEILGLEKRGLSAIVVATAGYRVAADKYAALKKVRFAKEEVLLYI
jgi:nitroreductase